MPSTGTGCREGLSLCVLGHPGSREGAPGPAKPFPVGSACHAGPATGPSPLGPMPGASGPHPAVCGKQLCWVGIQQVSGSPLTRPDDQADMECCLWRFNETQCVKAAPPLQQGADVSRTQSGCLCTCGQGHAGHRGLSWLSKPNTLAVQWLGLGAFFAKGPGSIPGLGAKVLQPMQSSQRKEKKEPFPAPAHHPLRWPHGMCLQHHSAPSVPTL